MGTPWPSVKPGALRHRINIEQKTLTPDGMGGNSISWGVFAQVWAAIWPRSAGKMQMESEQAQSKISHQIRIRYLPGLTSAMRVIYNGRVFHIVEAPINYEERQIYIDLLCLEITSPQEYGT